MTIIVELNQVKLSQITLKVNELSLMGRIKLKNSMVHIALGVFYGDILLS